MLNKIFLQGRLVADPELRHTPNGVAVASFRLAVDRDFKDRDTGERKADFFNIVAWRQQAEFLSRYFNKGSMILIEGKLQSRDYTDKDGNRRYATEVVVDSIFFPGSRRETEGGRGGYDAPPIGGYAQPSGYPTSQPSGYAPSGYAPAQPAAHEAVGYPDASREDASLPRDYPTSAPTADQFADLTDDDGELPF